MHRKLHIVVVSILVAFVLGSCNSKPDHRKYIPKDASLVAGVNLSSLGKKIAWNLITGSKLFKEMEKKMPEKNGSNVMSGIDKAGIDVMNTFYVYLKPDNRFKGEMKVTALVPLSDADAWEAYVKKSFPQSAVKEHNKLKLTNLGENMYVGWNKHLLIIMNTLTGDGSEMTAEMDNAFGISDENSIKSNKNFEQLQGANHDLSLWVNYGEIMDAYNDKMGAAPAGVTLSKSMWKETAIACGFDFVKGKITGDWSYYSSKSLEDMYKEFGSKNVDNDLASRLPGKNLNMLTAMHFSTKAMRAMMDSTGILGLANAQLSQQGTNVDNILDAFTGDMAFTVNDLSVVSTTGPEGYPSQKTNFSMSFVMKINQQDKFKQLMTFAQAVNLQPYGTGYYMPISDKDSVFFLYDNNYAVFSNKSATAANILSGKPEQGLSPALANNVKGHPFNLFIDVKETVDKLDLGKALSSGDAAVFGEAKNLLSNISFSGGEYKNNAMQARMEINFVNKDENTIITLLDFGMRVSDAINKGSDLIEEGVREGADSTNMPM